MTQTPPTRMNSLMARNGDVMRMPETSTRRGGHGGMAWSVPFAEPERMEMIQPQDGAVDPRTRLANIRSHQQSDGLHESEDARLTGGTRSLDRRLLGLNVLDTSMKRASAKVAATVQVEVA